MSSLQTSFKQTNGYFIVTATITATNIPVYGVTTAQTGAGGSNVSPVLSPITTLALAAGQVLKDMGKTITTGSVGDTGATAAKINGLGPRVFRKVQLLNQGNTVATATTNVGNGVGSGFTGTDVGTAGSGYNTFYIEIPTSGSPASTVANFASLVYLPGMPGFSY